MFVYSVRVSHGVPSLKNKSLSPCRWPVNNFDARLVCVAGVKRGGGRGGGREFGRRIREGGGGGGGEGYLPSSTPPFFSFPPPLPPPLYTPATQANARQIYLVTVEHVVFGQQRIFMTDVNTITIFTFDLVHDSSGSLFLDLVFWFFSVCLKLSE